MSHTSQENFNDRVYRLSQQMNAAYSEHSMSDLHAGNRPSFPDPPAVPRVLPLPPTAPEPRAPLRERAVRFDVRRLMEPPRRVVLAVQNSARHLISDACRGRMRAPRRYLAVVAFVAVTLLWFVMCYCVGRALS